MNRNRDIQMARFLAGEMNAKEEIAFRNEFQGNPAQWNELKNMEKSWKYFDDKPNGRSRDSQSAWNQLHRRLEEDGLLESQSMVERRGRVTPLLRMAATILVLIALGVPALYFGILREPEKNTENHNIAESGIQTVDLPDGSRVYLNEGSEISYPPSFQQERSVKLKGEAYFEVMSDPVNPFTVRSGNVIVSVLGTSFNVKSSENYSSVEVFVETGKVRLSHENSSEFITLVPGELGESTPTKLSKSDQIEPNYISWKTKDFKFVDAELTEVLDELEESYHVTIHTNGVELDDLKITTSYSEQSIDAILETIGTAFGLTVSNSEEGYYLTN